VAERGEPLPPAWQLPPGLRAVSLDALKAEWKLRDIIKADDSNDRATFGRLTDALVHKGYANVRDQRIWSIAK
jgi:hypothetical protein